MTCKRYSYKWPGLAKFTEVLASLNNNPTATAKHFGVSRGTVYTWMANNGIHNGSDNNLPTVINTQAVDPAVCEFNINQLRSEQIGEMVWFVLSDVCAMVDYKSPSTATNLLKSDNLLKREVVNSVGKSQAMWMVNEPGLYRFLVRCQLPKADAFERWATEVVLPSIRKTGSYSLAPVETSEEKLARLMGIRSEQVIAEARSYTDQRIKQIESKNYATLDQVKQISDGAAKRVIDQANKWAKDFEKEEKRCAALRHDQLVQSNIHSVSITDILIKEIRAPIKERVYPLHGLGKKDQLSRAKYTEEDQAIAADELNKFKRRYGLHGWDVLTGSANA